MHVVRVRVTTFNPEEDRRRIRWASQIRGAFLKANRIFHPYGLEIVEGGRLDLDPGVSRLLLTHNLWESAGQSRGFGTTHHHEEYFRYRRMARMGGHEYAASAARVVAETVGGGSASTEAIRILHRNRAANEVATYWVPMITEPNSAGHTLCPPFYNNITTNEEGILIEQDASRTTLAHELGHLLMRAGHCAMPDQHGGECACAPADNLMHLNGSARSRSPVLTEQQVARLFRVGGANGYVIRSGR